VRLLEYSFILLYHLVLISATNTLACCSVIGYTLLLSLIEYKTLVMRGDLESANEILPSIPKTQYNRLVSVFDPQ
jgi:hypothetical protein